MKRYNVEGNTFSIIFMVIWCSVLAVMMWVMSRAIIEAGVDFELFIIIIPSIMMLVGLAVLLSNVFGILRKRKALSGRKSFGIVQELKFQRNNSQISYRMVFSYKGEDDKEYEAVTTVKDEYSSQFKVGTKIPILVNGRYAYYDVDALERGTFADMSQDGFTEETIHSDANKNGYIICDCGYIVKSGLLYCPHCGKAVEDMHKGCTDESHDHNNYCPSCGAKIGEKDKFCAKCGYRLYD